jgi:hypothetical protein
MPLELIRPATCDGFAPTTCIKVTAPALGALTCTVWLEPTSKLFQLIAARWVDCKTVVVDGTWVMDADPHAAGRVGVRGGLGRRPRWRRQSGHRRDGQRTGANRMPPTRHVHVPSLAWMAGENTIAAGRA